MKTYKELYLSQGSDLWLEVRKSHITATDIAKILGKNPWSTPLDCYNEKINGKTTPLNDAMKRGQELEVKARSFLEKRDGIELSARCFESVNHPFLMASLDATDKHCTRGYEIKCPGEKAMTKALEGKYDKIYDWQCQAQMYVMGWDSIELLYYHNDFITASFIIKRDEAKIKDMLKVVELFWTHNLLALTPPPSKERKLEEISCPNVTELALAWRDAIGLEKEAIRTRKAIEEDLKALVGDSDCVITRAGVKHISIERKGNVDTIKLYDKYNITEEELETYRKKSTSYSKFSIV